MLSSHELDRAEALADRVVALTAGTTGAGETAPPDPGAARSPAPAEGTVSHVA